MTTPLVITRDEHLLDEALRLAAAAGVTPEVAGDAGAGLRSWLAAPVVLVGVDQAPALERLAPPRRPGVHLLTAGGPGPEVYRLALALGAEDVVELPAAETWLVQALTDLADTSRARGLTLGVVGGCGGAGASVLAVALGQVAARGGPALVVDADPRGAGLDRLVGLEEVPGVHWDALQQTSGRLSARSLREALPRRDGLGVLTWGPGTACPLVALPVREALSAAQRGHDTVVLDLPRAGDALTEELVARCDQLVVVTTATVLAVAATARLCARLPYSTRRIVVRGRGVSPADVAAVTGVPEVVCMPSQRGLDESIDLGLGPVRGRRGPLARTAAGILDAAMPTGAVA